MTRKFSLAASVLAGSLMAGVLAAQASPSAKPTPSSSSMQHATTQPTHQDTTAAKASTAKTGARHAAWTKDQIKEAQTGLAKAGFYKGEPTGVFNKQTRKAIRAYQKANKLPVTGRLNNDLLTRLQSA
jgi:peptidoglycan hydrolase-like protein with peptidoglycan-binding domain